MDTDVQTRALRMRMYVNCSECARWIDVLAGRKPRRVGEFEDLVRHNEEDHDGWLELIEVDKV